jgi:hypothetical protein
VEEVQTSIVAEALSKSTDGGSTSVCDDSCVTLVQSSGHEEPVSGKGDPLGAVSPLKVAEDVAEQRETVLLGVPKFQRTPTDEEIAEIRARAQAVSISLGRVVTEEECIAGLLELMVYNDSVRRQAQEQDIVRDTYAGYPLDEAVVLNLIRDSRLPSPEELEEVRQHAQIHYASSGCAPTDEQWAYVLWFIMAQRDASAQTSTPSHPVSNFAIYLQLHGYPEVHRCPTEEEFAMVKAEAAGLGRPTTELECVQALLTLMTQNDARDLQLQLQAQNEAALEAVRSGSDSRMMFDDICPVSDSGIYCDAALSWMATSFDASAGLQSSVLNSWTLRYVSSGTTEFRGIDVDMTDATPEPVVGGNMPVEVDRVDVLAKDAEMEVHEETLAMNELMGLINDVEMQAGVTHSTSSQKRQDPRVMHSPVSLHEQTLESRRTQDPRRRSAPRYSDPYDSRDPHVNGDSRSERYSPVRDGWHSNDEGHERRDKGKRRQSSYSDGEDGFASYSHSCDDGAGYSPRSECVYSDEERYHNSRDKGYSREAMCGDRYGESGISYRPHSPRDGGYSPCERSKYSEEGEERYDHRDEMVRKGRGVEPGRHRRGCRCRECEDAIWGDSQLSSGEGQSSKPVERKTLGDADEDGRAPHAKNDDGYDDRNDYSERSHSDKGKDRDRTSRREYKEEDEFEDVDSETVRLMEKIDKYGGAGLPVPEELLKRLKKLGWVIDDEG